MKLKLKILNDFLYLYEKHNAKIENYTIIIKKPPTVYGFLWCRNLGLNQRLIN